MPAVELVPFQPPFGLVPAVVGNAGAWGRGVEKLEETGRDFVAALPTLILAVAVFGLFAAIGWSIKRGVHRFARDRRRHRNVALVLGRLVNGLVLVVGVLVAAVIVFPDYTPSSLLATLGIGGLVVGFAFRDVLENYLAGVLMLLTEPFRIGDQIVFDRYEGTVEEIQTRATLILTYDGRRVVIPNAKLFTTPVTVNTAFESRRIEYDFGIGFGDDIARAKALIIETLRGQDGVLAEPPPDVLTYELGPSAVSLRVRWWITPPKRNDALEARDVVLEAVKRTLTAAGIDLPFPTTQVLFHDQTEETDGDRRRQREGWPARGDAAPKARGIATSLHAVSERLQRGADGVERGVITRHADAREEGEPAPGKAGP
jgi:small-conductance mechanosensitive channel